MYEEFFQSHLFLGKVVDISTYNPGEMASPIVFLKVQEPNSPLGFREDQVSIGDLWALMAPEKLDTVPSIAGEKSRG